MKLFIKRIFLFMLPIIMILFFGLFYGETPRSSKSLLFSVNHKDSLLLNTKNPRIVFVGGSNISFGLDSQIFKDSLALNPINTGIHANLGIKYMLENCLNYLQKGDIVIIIPEYDHFYRSYDFVSEELLRTVLEVNPEKINNLSINQIIYLLQYLPKYSISKFKPSEYFGFQESDVYSVNSFNNYGDVDAHWELENRPFNSITINGDFQTVVVDKLKQFVQNADEIGALVYISFPSLDKQSFINSKENILMIEEVLKSENFKLLGSVERYIMPEELMFNTHYHLNAEGVNYRTNLLLEDLKANLFF